MATKIAAITGPVLNPATDLPGFMERTALLSHLPEVPADDGQFVIFLEPVPDGDMGMAVVAGVVPVQIDVVNAAHKYADVKHEDVSELQSRLVGAAEILWKESGTGTKWALVRLGGAVPANGFWAKIGEKAADGDNKWKYPWAEQEKTVAGYGGWTDLSGGRSGTTEADPARNTVEDMNTGVGADRQGNGVILEHLDTAEYTFTIQPCPDGVVIWMREVPGPDGTTEYWFQYANGVDGTCV